jgi:hypothetical protein
MPRTEFAGHVSNVRSAYEGLSRQLGVPLETVVQFAEERRLNDLFDYETREAPAETGSTGLNPNRVLGVINALEVIWAAQEGREPNTQRTKGYTPQ